MLYAGNKGLVAHECILDLRPITKATGVTRRRRGQAADRLRLPRADDVVPGGRHADGGADRERGPGRAGPVLRRDDRDPARRSTGWRRATGRRATTRWRNAPHTAAMVTADEWAHPYPRSVAAYPAGVDRTAKYWPPVRRIDGAYGDRNLVCSCPPPEAFARPTLRASLRGARSGSGGRERGRGRAGPGRGAGRWYVPSGSSSPVSSNTITPLQSRLQPCSGWDGDDAGSFAVDGVGGGTGGLVLTHRGLRTMGVLCHGSHDQ